MSSGMWQSASITWARRRFPAWPPSRLSTSGQLRDVDDEPAFTPAIESLGWQLRMREPGHRFFRRPAGQPRDVHVHVYTAGGGWERSHLPFRDYLRAHPERAQAYDGLKRGLAARYRDDRWAYTEGKTPFMEETTLLAEAWAIEAGWSPEAEPNG